MCVVGDPVTRDQAQEMIFRLESFYLTGPHMPEIQRILGMNATNCTDRMEEALKLQKSVNHLHLEYFSTSRFRRDEHEYGIVDWRGHTNSYFDLPKYSSMEDLHEEAIKLAKAFPFLNLMCTVFEYYDTPLDDPLMKLRIFEGEVLIVPVMSFHSFKRQKGSYKRGSKPAISLEEFQKAWIKIRGKYA